MTRKYHTLLTRDSKQARWAIEFGAYERADVEAERDDVKDRGFHTKIITTGDKQADIDAAVARLNES